MVLSMERVVAVAAVLQNSVEEVFAEEPEFHLKRQGRFILFSGHFIQNEYYYKDGLFTPKKQVF